MFIAFDTSDNYLETYLKDAMTESSSLSDGAVGYSRPKVLSANIGIILKEAGAKDWVLDESS